MVEETTKQKRTDNSVMYMFMMIVLLVVAMFASYIIGIQAQQKVCAKAFELLKNSSNERITVEGGTITVSTCKTVGGLI